ncbi:MAG TPA: M23 family metallopeptidase [Burkholderiales bacterium]|nr:M23 family metallopeptidase [Burkholderiales bacterium]
MNIILVSENLAKAKTITLGMPHIALLGAAAVSSVIVLAALLHYAVVRFAPDFNVPYLDSLLGSSRHEIGDADQFHMRENINAIAIRVGQMQAQLLRLDTLGERLARLAGFKPHDLLFGETPGQGGVAPGALGEPLSLADVTRQLDTLTRQVDERSDRLGILESLFTLDRARKQLVPTMAPIEGGWNSSDYGWRIDPFTGQRAFHEGVDFIAEHGTTIQAAAAGVVSYSGLHPQYGNMIEIDHGNGLVTRYAHASARAVKMGDLVMRGAKVGEVGKTGRATGTHLHFEVRRNGAPQNPARFLRLPG